MYYVNKASSEPWGLPAFSSSVSCLMIQPTPKRLGLPLANTWPSMTAHDIDAMFKNEKELDLDFIFGHCNFGEASTKVFCPASNSQCGKAPDNHCLMSFSFIRSAHSKCGECNAACCSSFLRRQLFSLLTLIDSSTWLACPSSSNLNLRVS